MEYINSRLSLKLYLLFCFIILDYTLTYIGINILYFIDEANPLMAWIFQLPFTTGFLIKFIYTSCITVFLDYCIKTNIRMIPPAINLCLAVNLVILAMHISWIMKYLFVL